MGASRQRPRESRRREIRPASALPPLALLLIGLIPSAAAQNGPADREQAARDLIANAAQALAERRAPGFLDALDRPLANQLRKPVEALVRDYDIQSGLDFAPAAGDDRGVSLAVTWRMDLTAREGGRAVTHRERRVTCRVESRGGALRIVAVDGALEAPGLFSSPDIGGAWDLLLTASTALVGAFGPGQLRDPDTTAAGFMTAFDSKMAGYEALRAGVAALAAQGRINCTLTLTSNEGTDAVRTVAVDWVLEVAGSETGIRILERESQLTFLIERHGKRWLIVSVSPLDLFTK